VDFESRARACREPRRGGRATGASAAGIEEETTATTRGEPGVPTVEVQAALVASPWSARITGVLVRRDVRPRRLHGTGPLPSRLLSRFVTCKTSPPAPSALLLHARDTLPGSARPRPCLDLKLLLVLPARDPLPRTQTVMHRLLAGES
jgi:hypothetical protein